MSAAQRCKLSNGKRKFLSRLRESVAGDASAHMQSNSSVHDELVEQTRAIAHGGFGAVHRLLRKVGLGKRVGNALRLFKVHKPYHASDHVLNCAYNALCGGHTLNDIA